MQPISDQFYDEGEGDESLDSSPESPSKDQKDHELKVSKFYSCVHLPMTYTLLVVPDWGHSTESWTQGIKEQASPPYQFRLITLRNNDQQEELTPQRVPRTGQTLCCSVEAVGPMLSSEAAMPHRSSNLRPMAPKPVCKRCSLGWRHCLWVVLSSPKFSSWTYWKVGSLFGRGMYFFKQTFIRPKPHPSSLWRVSNKWEYI